MRDRYLALPIEEIASDPAVRKMGMRMFGNNCAQCHGADAKGSYGFPNLTDGDWIYGGDPDTIKATLVNGRQAAMPAWGSILGDQGIADVTSMSVAQWPRCEKRRSLRAKSLPDLLRGLPRC